MAVSGHLRSNRPDVFCKKMFLKMSLNSRKNVCARVSFLITLQALGLRHFRWLLLTFTLRREIFPWIYFHESFFFNISGGFNFANWLPVDFSRAFIYANLSFTKVLHILIFSWFVLQLVVCESRNSCPNFLIFQIALFGYKRLNSRLFDIL